MSLLFGLVADNSSGKQFLHIHKDDDGTHLTLTGDYDDQDIQIDFESLSAGEVDSLIHFLRIEASND